jgi:hypothetical protein
MASQVNRYADHQGPRGWPLVANRQIQMDGMIYPRNSELPLERLDAPAIKRLLDTKSASFVPPSSAPRAQPRALPESTPPAARPAIQWIEDRDPETAWDLTLEANLRVIGDAAVVEDLMLATPHGRDVYKRKNAVAAARRAEQRRAQATQHLQERLASRGVL